MEYLCTMCGRPIASKRNRLFCSMACMHANWLRSQKKWRETVQARNKRTPVISRGALIEGQEKRKRGFGSPLYDKEKALTIQRMGGLASPSRFDKNRERASEAGKKARKNDAMRREG